MDPHWSYADPDPPNLVNADPDPGQKITKFYFIISLSRIYYHCIFDLVLVCCIVNSVIFYMLNAQPFFLQFQIKVTTYWYYFIFTGGLTLRRGGENSGNGGPGAGKLVTISVVGLSGGEKEKGSMGIGKSCLCNRYSK